MSASLFADLCIDYRERPAINYIEYNEGEKTFGELQKGDEVYLYTYLNDKILNITVNGKLIVGRNNIYIKTKSFKLNLSSKTQKVSNDIIFGPINSSMCGNGYTYSSDRVKDCSICASWNGGWAVGTNRESVLKYAKSDISNSIQKIQNNVENLQKEIKILTNKLENL